MNNPCLLPKLPESVLVTGGAGFIGTHLCRELRNRGHDVTSLDLRDPPTEIDGVRYVQGDARDRLQMSHLLRSTRSTTVYHLAASVSVPFCQSHPLESYSNNVGSTVAVLESCREISRQRPIRVAFSSSAAVYGDLGNDGKPISETAVSHRFSSFYAAQKHASEKALEIFHAQYALPAMVYRFFNVYGAGQDPDSPYSGVISVFMRQARENRALRLDNSGIQTRDFIAVQELVKAAASALDLPSGAWDGQPINLGSGTAVSIRDLACLIRDLSRSKAELQSAPSRPGDILHSLADTRRAASVLSFRAKTDLSAGLERMLA